MNVASQNYITKLYEIAYKSKGKSRLEFRDIDD